ncbi:16S rRNA (uracil(1498)-N(3))-methyltransferase [Pseudoxanthomonas kalamensis DSM 18571]|uniref:16S rRNA (uracil(1498)-N(3))-methyltransferase n=1 Tax=Pseudoxanthomonas kalamensis TaxID=289483 RepID=UPI001391C1E6|nr:16S rRNA (uracil(1498)-N(3))-methyltransferase [Pseudoxanthomonas kalamensis]KAF1709310.1 16S rRNA (uracil(1498)-N(3))-methyltransferase [Pseudoxanthomonas kalamensis DSM 18571]
MRLTRCHVEVPLAVGQTLTLPETAATHLVRVLRLRAGDDCVLFNGDGHDYAARLQSVDKRAVVVEVLARTPVPRESPLRITLLQGVARGEKMDLILQKTTELGVTAIVPVLAERTEVKLDAARTAKRMQHWRSVLVSACEQSGRATIPALAEPQPLVTAAAIQATLKLVLDPEGEYTLADLPVPEPAEVAIAIGPEGGWSPRDRQALVEAGFMGLRLGPRVLRTETAGLATIAALQSRFGDF